MKCGAMLGLVGGVALALVAARPAPPAPPPPIEGALIAHRGGRAHGPDNSLAAISAAAARGADAVELDSDGRCRPRAGARSTR
jgi:hypothetical protein